MIRAVPNVRVRSQGRQAAGSSFAPVQEADSCGFLAVSCPWLLVDVGGLAVADGQWEEGEVQVYFPASHPLSAVCLLNVHLLPGVSHLW